MIERDELYDALEACLAALDEGASLQNALARYPELAAQLRPLLLAAQASGAGAHLTRVPVGAQVVGRAQFLARANELSAANGRAAVAPVAGRGWWSRLRAQLAPPMAGLSPLARAFVTGLVVLAGLGTGYGAVAASAESLPGDPLYGVKRTVESTQLLLAPDDRARTQLQAEFDRRRVSEVQVVANEHRQVAVDFTGTLISMTGAQGQDWLVSGVVVLVGPQVPVEGEPSLGVQLRVQGSVQANGLIQAERVTVLQAHATEPAETPIPAATPTTVESSDELTATPSESVSGSPSDTPAPAVTPGPADTQEGGPEPSHTPEATEGGEPGGGPTRTPRPTEGGEHGGPTQTPRPTEGGGPTQTPRPTEGGESGGWKTRTPQPTVGGLPSPSTTPRPTDNDDHHGGSPTPTSTPTPTNNGGNHSGGGGSSASSTPQPDR